jgi:hypothetical protein
VPPPAVRRGIDPRARSWLIAGAIVVVLIILAVSGALEGMGGDSGSDPSQRRQGDPAVYERIESEAECQALQGEFDQAMDNAEARQPGDPLPDVSLDYAEAADARLEEVDCYGLRLPRRPGGPAGSSPVWPGRCAERRANPRRAALQLK